MGPGRVHIRRVPALPASGAFGENDPFAQPSTSQARRELFQVAACSRLCALGVATRLAKAGLPRTMGDEFCAGAQN
jgi:hypothetical protein